LDLDRIYFGYGKQVTNAVINDYNFKQEIDASVEELIGIDNQAANEDIITLGEMNALKDLFNKTCW
jgi:hypothetical protein